MKFRHKKNGKTFELAPINGKYHLVVALDSPEAVAAFRKEHHGIVFGARVTPEGEKKRPVVPFRKLEEI